MHKITAPILLAAAFFSFIVLGLPDGMLGVAWPSASAEFGKPIGSLGLIMATFTAGYFAMTVSVGVVTRRIGYARVMILASTLLTTGVLAAATVPVWTGFLASFVLLGAGAGLLDGGLNAYGTTHFRPRDLNWLHAAYGVGATLGPSIMTPIVASEASWRLGYGATAAVGVVMVALFFAVRGRFYGRDDVAAAAEERADSNEPGGEERPADAAEPPAERTPQHGTAPEPRGKRPIRAIVTGSLLLFFFYTGMEVIAGQWAYTLLTVGRGIAAEVAGPWVAGYYGFLTVGRVLFGWIAERLPTRLLVHYTTAGAAAGIALIWIGTPPALAAVGLFLLGFSLAPMFPLLVGETPRRVGSSRADDMVGAQIGAANIGAVVLVGATGIGVELFNLEFVGLILAVSVVLFVLCNELVSRATRAGEAATE